jgi:threonine dehydrogenase-like Zn-dependent dehydrogenase
VTIVGSFVGRNKFPGSIAVLESGILNLLGLISHDIKLSELPEAIEAARQRYIRPISARYIHRKEVQPYEKENPDL